MVLKAVLSCFFLRLNFFVNKMVSFFFLMVLVYNLPYFLNFLWQLFYTHTRVIMLNYKEYSLNVIEMALSLWWQPFYTYTHLRTLLLNYKDCALHVIEMSLNLLSLYSIIIRFFWSVLLVATAVPNVI